MSIETHLVSIRTYLEDIASTQQQILRMMQQQEDAKVRQGIAEREGVKPSDVAVARGDDNITVTAVRRTGNMLEDNVPPWPDYDAQTVADVLAEETLAKDDMRAYALAYERKNKARKTVIDALENWNS